MCEHRVEEGLTGCADVDDVGARLLKDGWLATDVEDEFRYV